MLIIDEYADSKLVTTLEAITSNAQSYKCVHFRFSGMQLGTVDEDPRQRVIAAAKEAFSFSVAKIYLCEDGDVFLLASALSGKQVRRVIAGVAELLREAVVDYFELPQDMHLLLARLEAKSEKRQQTDEALRIKSEQEQAQQRRRLIFHDHLLQRNLADIASRRRRREQAEIMIIEDDMFSRKLVESVLHGQYSLTALNNAEHALFAYAKCAPDVLFLDINLPHITAQDLLEKIITLDPDAYIILFSGNSDRKNIEQALLLGAKGFISKPFTGNKLFQYINHCPTIRKGNFSVH